MRNGDRQQVTWAGASRPSVYEHRESSGFGTLVRWRAGALAFSDGFIGGVVGGALFRLINARFSWTDWGYSWTDVVSLALVLGSFEAWRVTQGRTLARAGGHLFGLLVAVLVLWWAVHRWAPPADGEPKRQPPSRRALAAQQPQTLRTGGLAL